MTPLDTLDKYMSKIPEWYLDGDYWKVDHYLSDNNDTFECHSWIDRRLEKDGSIHTGYSELEGGYDEGQCESTTHDSVDQMIQAEFIDP